MESQWWILSLVHVLDIVSSKSTYLNSLSPGTCGDNLKRKFILPIATFNTELYRWSVNIGSGNYLVPSCKKTIAWANVDQTYVSILQHYTTIS